MTDTAVTAAQLHEWYGPLHARDPRTKVEGLRWAPQASDEGEWIIDGLVKYRTQPKVISPAHAADLLGMAAVKAVESVDIAKTTPDGWCVAVGESVATAPTLSEAVAITMHKSLDMEKQT